MNKVDILINPYNSITKIAVNNRTVSSYSELTKYLNEPFYTWYDKLLDCISRELNDEFHLKVISGTTEGRILKGLTEQYEDCISFQHEDFVINTPLIERMKQLEELTRLQNISIEKKKFSITFLTNLGISIDSQLLDYPFCELSVNVNHYSEGGFSELNKEEVHFIHVGTSDEAEVVYNKLKKKQISAIIIVTNGGSKIKKWNNIFVCECSEEKLTRVISEMFEFRWIRAHFYEILLFVEKQVADNKDVLDRLQFIKMVEPFVVVKGPSEMEVNTSAELQIKSFPENAPIPDLYYSTSNDQVLFLDGINLTALSAGEAKVEVYSKGEIEPLSSFLVKVFQQHRLETINLHEGDLTLGVQDIVQLSYDVYPEFPDNINELQWDTSDVSVARVDQNGRVVAISPGHCTISLSTKDVSASCLVCVKSRIKELNLTAKELNLNIGKTVPLQVTYKPSDVINPEVSFSISDNNVAIYEDGVIKAKGIGKTIITFYSENQEVSQSCEITVSSTLYKKEKRNIPLRFSAILLLLYISLLFYVPSLVFSSISLLFPFIGTVSGFLALQKNNSKGTSFICTAIHLFFLVLHF